MSQTHTITAYANVPAKGAQGVLQVLAQSLAAGPCSSKVANYIMCINYLKMKEYEVSSVPAVTPGDHKFLCITP